MAAYLPTIHLLHVEDEPNDAFLVRRALLQADPNWTIAHVADGEEALAYLSGAGQYADRDRYPVPDLVLLDLELHSMHGFDLLAWMRAHPQFRRLPVIVLSGSADETDRACAQDLGANSFFTKTPLYHGLAESVSRLVGTRLAPVAGCLDPPLARAAGTAQLARKTPGSRAARV